MIPLPLPFTALRAGSWLESCLCVCVIALPFFLCGCGFAFSNAYCMPRVISDRIRPEALTTEDCIRFECRYPNQAFASSLSQFSAAINDAHFRAACFVGIRVSEGTDIGIVFAKLYADRMDAMAVHERKQRHSLVVYRKEE